MGSRRLDLMPECNLNGAALDVFEAACCHHCINPECTRSQFGGSKFDKRVGNWFERLFSAVPKLAPDDPRFAAIAGKNFILIDPSRRIPEVSSSWDDPRDLAVPQATAPSPPAPIVAAPPGDPTPPPAPEVVVPEPSPQPSAPRKALPRHMVLANTSSQSGRILQAETPSAPQKDAWAGPVSTPDTNVPVVKRGATVKLGGSGV